MIKSDIVYLVRKILRGPKGLLACSQRSNFGHSPCPTESSQITSHTMSWISTLITSSNLIQYFWCDIYIYIFQFFRRNFCMHFPWPCLSSIEVQNSKSVLRNSKLPQATVRGSVRKLYVHWNRSIYFRQLLTALIIFLHIFVHNLPWI
jgi:hypothetical protein